MDFQYSLPVNIIFGCGKAAQVGPVARQYGTKALIVTGSSSAKRSGRYDKVRASLESEGVDSVLFSKRIELK